MDVHNTATRSYNMSRIRAKNTKPEILVRKFLFSHGFRYRIHVKYLIGKPDIVLAKYKTVIFIHGCFWHAHEVCRYYVVPKSNTEFWINKLRSNTQRDAENFSKLAVSGWKIITIFECELKAEKLNQTLNNLLVELH